MPASLFSLVIQWKTFGVLWLIIPDPIIQRLGREAKQSILPIISKFRIRSVALSLHICDFHDIVYKGSIIAHSPPQRFL